MRFLKSLSGIVVLLLLIFSSCKKDSPTYDTTPTFYFLNGGTTYFDNALILFPSADTVTFNLVISSTFFLSKEITITLNADDAYRESYNSANGTNYQAMPANAYSFQTTFTAAVNSIYDTIPVKLNKQYLASGNFMLPVRIAGVTDYNIDSASSVVYLHTESNELSGIYNSTGTKIMYIGDAADNNIESTDSFSINKSLIPVSIINSELDYADLGANGWKYSLSFGDDGKTFTVGINKVILNSVQAGSFKVLASSYDSASKDIYIKTSYKNSGGNERIVEESLTLQ